MSKEAYYFSHDANARRDPKILAMRNEFGNEGYGWYWILIEMLSEQKDYKLKHTKWVTNAIAMEMLCDVNGAQNFVTSCINDYELFVSDGEYFWSESLIRRMDLKEEKRKKKVEAGRKGAEKRWNNNDDITLLKQSDSSAKAKHSKGKESKVKESKVKEIKESKIQFADTVFLTQEEYDRLVSDFDKRTVDIYIERLDEWQSNNPKKQKKDHNKTLRVWMKDIKNPTKKTFDDYINSL